MLWVLKRSVSLRRFFRVPKTNVQTDGLEIFCLSGHMEFGDKCLTIQVGTENCQAYHLHKIYILTLMLKYSKELEV